MTTPAIRYPPWDPKARLRICDPCPYCLDDDPDEANCECSCHEYDEPEPAATEDPS